MDSNSRHKMGDNIVLNFFSCGRIFNGIICGFKYTDYGKVLYDIKLKPFSTGPDTDFSTVLKDVDSYFVQKLEEQLESSEEINLN